MSVYGTGSLILILEAFLGSVLMYLRFGVPLHETTLVFPLKEGERIYLSSTFEMPTGIQ